MDSENRVSDFEWTNNNVLAFIKAYEQEPMVWNPHNALRKEKASVKAGWQRISMKMGTSVADLKRKKESLMATYRTVKKKYKGKDNEMPTWFAFEALDKFLAPLYVDGDDNNGSRGNYTSDRIFESDDEELNTSRNPVKFENDNDEPQYFHAEYLDEVNSPLGVESNVEDVLYEPSRKVRRPNKRVKPSEVNVSPEFIESEDECSLYAKLLAIKLRRLEPSVREDIMYEIDTLFMKRRRGLCGDDSE